MTIFTQYEEKPQLWDLDTEEAERDARAFWAKIQNTPHPKFRIGQVVEFWTGYNDDIRAKATIKAIEGNNIYVYNDCYWFPIKDDNRRKIKEIA